MQPRLIFPSKKYKASFLAAVAEYQAEEIQRYMLMSIGDLTGNFDDYLQELKDHAKGKNLPVGKVPYTELWLVDDQQYIGRLIIRHKLNRNLKNKGGHIGYAIRPSQRRKGYGKMVLALGLLEARKLGLKKVLVTCDDNNISSHKIIEYNGGILEDIRYLSTDQIKKRRYWIAL